MTKSILSIFLLLFIPIFMASCDNDNNTTQEGVARTENDFFNDPDHVANPEIDHVVMSLEHATSPAEDNLTGDLGNDVFTFRYDQTTSHKYCWEDPDVDAMHFMDLIDSGDNVILTVQANGDCVTEVIEAGDYIVRLHHDGREERIHPIFIVPQMDEVARANNVNNPKGILASAGQLFLGLIEKLDIDIIQPTNAQTVEANIDTVLLTGRCVGCNLAGADFSGSTLGPVDLTNADLTNANMSHTSCSGALFINANLSGATLNSFSFLDGADFSGANLTGADFSTSDLNNTKFTGATLTNANFASAIWCTGNCTCFETSIGSCVGCASADSCS